VQLLLQSVPEKGTSIKILDETIVGVVARRVFSSHLKSLNIKKDKVTFDMGNPKTWQDSTGLQEPSPELWNEYTIGRFFSIV